MTDRTQDRSGSKAARDQRLGAALRDNLRRRKAQARVRAERSGDMGDDAEATVAEVAQDPDMGPGPGGETGSDKVRDDS